MTPDEQGNESSDRQDVIRSDEDSASRVTERKRSPFLLEAISAVLAPLGVPWAKEIQAEAARAKRKAEEAKEAALRAGREKVNEVSGRGPKQT